MPGEHADEVLRVRIAEVVGDFLDLDARGLEQENGPLQTADEDHVNDRHAELGLEHTLDVLAAVSQPRGDLAHAAGGIFGDEAEHLETDGLAEPRGA